MIHIAPWMRGGGPDGGRRTRLPPGGVLYLYGPFKQDGQPHRAEQCGLRCEASGHIIPNGACAISDDVSDSRACAGTGARRTHIDAGQQSEALSFDPERAEGAIPNGYAQLTIPFSHDAWNKNARIYEIIRTMPFNAALAAGTLSEARFKHYIVQDAHYLIGFGRALALAGARPRAPDRIVQFAKSAEGAIVVERALHGSFSSSTASARRHLRRRRSHRHVITMFPYLLATAYAEPYEVLLGALLPCFWIYAEVGRDIHDRAAAANPYQAWIDTYSGEEFHNAVSAMIAATDEAAETASSSSRERDACRLRPRDAARMDVLGLGLSARDLARSRVGTVYPRGP